LGETLCGEIASELGPMGHGDRWRDTWGCRGSIC
jgi:hypothetical protein